MEKKKTKWWQYPLIPFIIGFDYLVKLIIYLVYVQVRIIKAPLTKPMLDNFRNWNDEQPYSVEAKQKDILILSVVWSLILVWYWLPWYWLPITIAIYIVLFIAILLFVLPKRIKE